MLITQLKNDENLQNFIIDNCCENEVCIEIDDEIDAEDYLVIKLDEYYQENVKSPNTPKSPDCLIVQICEDERYKVFVVELKNVKSQNNSHLSRSSIREKFETCLLNFTSDRFRPYFYDERNQFQLHLILVAGKVDKEKMKTFEFDFLLTIRPLSFANKRYAIQGKNPNPLIRPC
ncbi:MAG: hypothetical protein AAFO82_17670 [Bacteroidota bacterium]